MSFVEMLNNPNKQLEQIRIPIFTSNKVEFQQWFTAFSTCIHKTSLAPEFKMLRLESFLHGVGLSTKTCNNVCVSELPIFWPWTCCMSSPCLKERQTSLFFYHWVLWSMFPVFYVGYSGKLGSWPLHNKYYIIADPCECHWQNHTSKRYYSLLCVTRFTKCIAIQIFLS